MVEGAFYYPEQFHAFFEDRSRREALHTGGVRESFHLEYKASGAVDKADNNKKLEMARDVSAFANADGGQIIYGMTEKRSRSYSGSTRDWTPSLSGNLVRTGLATARHADDCGP